MSQQRVQPGTPMLAVEAVSKSFGPVRVLNAVSMQVMAGEVHALCGENGAGKSTLVKILMGVLQPDAGAIRFAGEEVAIRTPREGQRQGVALVSQELSLAPDLSVEDNIWLGSNEVPFFHRRAALRARAAAALATLGLPESLLERAAGELSVAEQQLVEIARNLCRSARILILDEPTATLAETDIERLFAALGRLRQEGCAIIYITHRIGEVFRICDCVTVLRNGEVVASRPVAKLSRHDLIELMLGGRLGDVYGAAHPDPTAEVLLKVRDLHVPGKVESLSFDLRKGHIFGIAGQIGSGAPHVVRALAGLVPAARATLTYAGAPFALAGRAEMLRAGFDFITEDRAVDGVFLERPVADNLIATRIRSLARLDLYLDRRTIARAAGAVAAAVSVDRGRVHDEAWTLSGGNQQKLLFGRALRPDRSGPHVLLLNEPTRGVDIGARSELYRLIRSFAAEGAGIVLHSTDLEELIALSDVVLTMFGPKEVRRYEGKEIQETKILIDITHGHAGSGTEAGAEGGAT